MSRAIEPKPRNPLNEQSPGRLLWNRWNLRQDRPKASLLKMIVRSQGILNIPAFHDDERKAIGQAPIFVQPAGEQPDGSLTQVFSMRNHFDKRIAANLFEPVSCNFAGGSPGHGVQPFPAHSLRGDNHRARFDEVDVPAKRVAMVLIACTRQGDPERSVCEKERDLTYLRFAVP